MSNAICVELVTPPFREILWTIVPQHHPAGSNFQRVCGSPYWLR
jgi:hypothetical protein